MNEPTETPLVDLLRIVPIDAVGKWDTGPFETSSTPYGSLCHRAADEIQRLNAAAPAGEPPTSKALAPLKAANLSAALRAIVRECHGAATWGGGPLAIPGPERPYSIDSYLPPHLLDLAVAALESTETPLQVIEAMRHDDIERAPSYEELRERHREKRL